MTVNISNNGNKLKGNMWQQDNIQPRVGLYVLMLVMLVIKKIKTIFTSLECHIM